VGKTGVGGTTAIEVEAASLPIRGKDRRRHSRFIVAGVAEVVLQNGSSLFRGRILNISEVGCYIQSLAYTQLQPATPVDILFVVGGKIVSLKAQSRNSTPRVGVGFHFTEVDRKTSAILQTILSGLRSNPSSAAPFRRQDGARA
jgi:hypothetical protein